MRIFKGLCRGFKDQTMGQISVIDIATVDEPDNPKAFKNTEVIVIVAKDFKDIGMEGVSSLEKIKTLSDEIAARQMKINEILYQIPDESAKIPDTMPVLTPESEDNEKQEVT